MISQQRAEELANKILKNTISSEEEQEWQEWYQSNLEEPIAVPESFAPSKAVHAARMMNVINGAISVKRQVRLWPRIAVAAAAVAAIAFGVWFFIGNKYQADGIKTGSEVYANDVAPGRNTATLQLADGKVIHLDTNKTSVVVTDSVKAAIMLTASTPRGGTYQVVLPDGTKVWLNADSKISFPSQFSGKERKIILTGEAYLEVAKHKLKPFIVESEGQQVEVLGTHFNVSAYGEEATVKTTLLEGSVRVKRSRSEDPSGEGGEEVLLKPNQQATLSSASKLEVASVDVSEVVAWKDGYFRFYEVDLETFMTTIARWYDIEVVYEGGIKQYKDLAFGGSVSRSKNISEVLKILAQTGKVHYQITGKKVIIKK